MSKIINFKEATEDKSCKEVISILSERLPQIEDLFILYRDKDNNINVVETNVTFQDKCVMLQLLQHSISMDLTNDVEGDI